MYKQAQNYVVTFSTPTTELTTMERTQSSTNLLIDTQSENHPQELTIMKMEERGSCGGAARIRDKFRGCLVGALVGDCIGTLFERDYSVSYSLLEDLHKSLTNLSEDEKLMDLHGIDLNLGPKRVREILETKRVSYASLTESREDNDDDKLLKGSDGMFLRRNSAVDTTSGSAPLVVIRRNSFSRPIERYSDDTVMTKSVIYALIKCKGFDARYAAQQMTEDYFLNMNRKFGGYVRDIFVQLRENGYGDPYGPAKKYSGGMAAQGNEAASRVCPISLHCWSHNEHQIVVEFATKLAKITNASKNGVHGAILQALAVHAAFNWDLQAEDYNCACGAEGVSVEQSRPSSRHGSPLLVRRRQSNFGSRLELPPAPRIQIEQQPKFFCENLLEKMNHLEGRSSSLFENLKHLIHSNSTNSGGKEFLKPSEATYCDKLRTTLEFLARSQPPTRIEVIERLGNGYKAIESVPGALYSFLFATKYDTIPEISTPIKSPVLRSIFQAISLGGETAALASMTGAMAGAYWGYKNIPAEILRVCEGSKEITKMADDLFNVTYANNVCPNCK